MGIWRSITEFLRSICSKLEMSLRDEDALDFHDWESEFWPSEKELIMEEDEVKKRNIPLVFIFEIILFCNILSR